MLGLGLRGPKNVPPTCTSFHCFSDNFWLKKTHDMLSPFELPWPLHLSSSVSGMRKGNAMISHHKAPWNNRYSGNKGRRPAASAFSISQHVVRALSSNSISAYSLEYVLQLDLLLTYMISSSFRSCGYSAIFSRWKCRNWQVYAWSASSCTVFQ